MPFLSPRQLFVKHGLSLTVNHPTNDESCSICHEDYSETTAAHQQVAEVQACGHSFHETCFFTWLYSDHLEGKGGTCPMCRRALYRGTGDRECVDNFMIHIAELIRKVSRTSRTEEIDELLAVLQGGLADSDFGEADREYWIWEVRKLRDISTVIGISDLSPQGQTSIDLVDRFFWGVIELLDNATTIEMRDAELEEFLWHSNWPQVMDLEYY